MFVLLFYQNMSFIMNDLYTIVFDPQMTGDFRLYNRIFYTDELTCKCLCDDLNKNHGLFMTFAVVRVTFEFL